MYNYSAVCGTLFSQNFPKLSFMLKSVFNAFNRNKIGEYFIKYIAYGGNFTIFTVDIGAN